MYFLSNAQFYQSQDLCQMQTNEVFFLLTAAIVFAFSVNYFRVHFSTYFVVVAVGFKQLCICHVQFEDLSCEKIITNKKDTDR